MDGRQLREAGREVTLRVTASVVLFHTSKSLVDRLYACVTESDLPIDITFIDNSSEPCIEPLAYPRASYRFLGKNVGYGSAHNLALAEAIKSDADFHVILNPDIAFPPTTMSTLGAYMAQNDDVGLVMPEVRYPDGEIQYLCKLLPTPMDLIGRRFLDKLLPKYVEKRNDRLEMRSSGYNRELNVPWLSGCFMFLRVSTIKEVGGFDERYFMYAEDIDLSRRLHAKYRTMYLPTTSIIHDHAKESFKSGKMMLIHIQNVIRYFNKWGWWFDKERREVNRRSIEEMHRKP